MKKKWIYIEPFVFIWQDERYFLLYNSLSNKKNVIPKNDTIDPIIQSLLINKNLYCVQLEDGIEEKKDFIDFIKILTSNLLGNIVVCSDLERPVNIPPKLILSKSVENSKKNNLEYFDDRILDNIKELTIQVSGDCHLNCENCGKYHLQLVHCGKSDHSLSHKKIENLIQQIKHLNLQKINITGGNIFALENFEHLVNIFSTTDVLKIYNIHYKQINSNKIPYILNKNETSLIRISVHCNDISETEIINQIKYYNSYNSRILWSFVVCSEDELELCYSILEKCNTIQHEIKPYYNKLNETFIRKFVFIDHEDIKDIKLSKKQIFANQVLNRNYFGKITIQANGLVYDNINFPAVGTIDDCLDDIVHKIIREGCSWRWIRSNDICDTCLYKFICPPPSNLEKLMKLKIICQKPRSYDII
jgi:pseudo-rSAM protein